ncbi:MAG: hypothetical protein Q8P68_01065 [Candidatus Peregrinibacteria bacterium]|nr:hypothetical protein [Candidatus Peregrinibacteria bacterium]MDZ4244339.1 hypothetical protein [Candidatus Gracilibacteria bacterium]
MKLKELLKISGLPVLFASLCCLSPVIVVVFGLGSVTFASTLADTLYGDYKWYFRALGLVLLAIAYIWYLRKNKGICTIDQAKRHRNEIINNIVVLLVAGVLGYIIFLYVIVHYIGVFLKIWA